MEDEDELNGDMGLEVMGNDDMDDGSVDNMDKDGEPANSYQVNAVHTLL